jgi:addiction module RelB/DinJ family antitoxin
MTTATINVRMPKELKLSVDRILCRYGMSTTELIRELYSNIVRNQTIPDVLGQDNIVRKQELLLKRRSALNSLVGIIPADTNLDALRAERISRQTDPGEHL